MGGLTLPQPYYDDGQVTIYDTIAETIFDRMAAPYGEHIILPRYGVEQRIEELARGGAAS